MGENKIPLLTDVVEPTVDHLPIIRDAEVLKEPIADEAGEADESDDQHTNEVTIYDVESLVAELQTHLASHTYELADELRRKAFADMEARVFKEISSHLRQQLPELIDAVIREHLMQQEEK